MTDSEPVCLAVARVLLGARSEAHRIRHARTHLAGMFRTMTIPAWWGVLSILARYPRRSG